MKESVEITTLDEEAWGEAWRNVGDVEAAVDFSFMEAEAEAEAEAEERELKRVWDFIEKAHQERSNENDQ